MAAAAASSPGPAARRYARSLPRPPRRSGRRGNSHSWRLRIRPDRCRAWPGRAQSPSMSKPGAPLVVPAPTHIEPLVRCTSPFVIVGELRIDRDVAERRSCRSAALTAAGRARAVAILVQVQLCRRARTDPGRCARRCAGRPRPRARQTPSGCSADAGAYDVVAEHAARRASAACR